MVVPSVCWKKTRSPAKEHEAIRPDERRIVTFATDLALQVVTRGSGVPQRVAKTVMRNGVLTQYSEERRSQEYVVSNTDKEGRMVVEHPVRAGWTQSASLKAEEATAGWLRYLVRVEAASSSALRIDERRPLQTTIQISDVSSQQIEVWARQKSITPQMQSALLELAKKKAAVAELESLVEARDEEMKQIFDDQQRLRENMKSLKGSAEEKALLQRYLGQLNEQESRLEALKKEKIELEKKVDAGEDEVAALVAAMNFEADV
jgi:hypothetical protein